MLFSWKQEAPASIGGGTFTEGSEVRLIDALRKQSADHIDAEKPDSGIDALTEAE